MPTNGMCRCGTVIEHRVAGIHDAFVMTVVGFLWGEPHIHWSKLVTSTSGNLIKRLKAFMSHMREDSGFSIENQPPIFNMTSAKAAERSAMMFASFVMGSPKPSGRSLVLSTRALAYWSFLLAEEKVWQFGAA